MRASPLTKSDASPFSESLEFCLDTVVVGAKLLAGDLLLPLLLECSREDEPLCDPVKLFFRELLPAASRFFASFCLFLALRAAAVLLLLDEAGAEALTDLPGFSPFSTRSTEVLVS